MFQTTNTQHSLEEIYQLCTKELEKELKKILQTKTPIPDLFMDAIQHLLLSPGKKIRPLLVYASGFALGCDSKLLLPAACAIEMIHTYSLLHDDLPAMDNADFRRGKPSCHKVFGEAMAILAGDVLQTLAFDSLAKASNSLTPEQKLKMIITLSTASGLEGMVGGQAMDMIGKYNSLNDLGTMYSLKTGALLTAAVKLAAIAANASTEALVGLENYAQKIGLAYQIQDDILDSEGIDIGKPNCLDKVNNKKTYVHWVGIDKAKLIVNELMQDAISAIDSLLNINKKPLYEFSYLLMNRKN